MRIDQSSPFQSFDIHREEGRPVSHIGRHSGESTKPSFSSDVVIRMLQAIGREDSNALMSQQVITDLKALVKELLDNALDSGATVIRIQTNDAGVEGLQVIDNGHGISPADFPKLTLKGATSKIANIDDLNSLEAKGFRVLPT
jgi:DNA mismatch repair protein PMS2